MHMRALLLAIMIALLPVRGWLGDAMAVGMALHDMASSASVAHGQGDGHARQGRTDSDNAAHADCLEHSAPADAGHSSCTQCSACDVCHSVALALNPAPIPPAGFQASMRPPTGAAFVSAEPQPGFKPPIA